MQQRSKTISGREDIRFLELMQHLMPLPINIGSFAKSGSGMYTLAEILCLQMAQRYNQNRDVEKSMYQFPIG